MDSASVLPFYSGIYSRGEGTAWYTDKRSAAGYGVGLSGRIQFQLYPYQCCCSKQSNTNNVGKRRTDRDAASGNRTDAETKQQTEEQSSETSFDVTQYIFVGDSRTVGMHETVGDSGCVWIGQVSAGLSWFQDTAVGEIDESVTQGSVIIINMGVNDLGNAWGYIDLLKEKIPQWMEKGAEVYYMSVNPVENHPYISNEDIANFNNILYNNLPSETGWIETNSYLLESGYSTQDGVHFDAETYQKIFNYTMEVLSGFGRQ